MTLGPHSCYARCTTETSHFASRKITDRKRPLSLSSGTNSEHTYTLAHSSSLLPNSSSFPFSPFSISEQYKLQSSTSKRYLPLTLVTLQIKRFLVPVVVVVPVPVAHFIKAIRRLSLPLSLHLSGRDERREVELVHLRFRRERHCCTGRVH